MEAERAAESVVGESADVGAGSGAGAVGVGGAEMAAGGGAVAISGGEKREVVSGGEGSGGGVWQAASSRAMVFMVSEETSLAMEEKALEIVSSVFKSL